MNIFYTTQWDLTTIPDTPLAREWSRRMRERLGGRNPGADTRRIIARCPLCGQPHSVSQMRSHLPVCKREHPVTAIAIKRQLENKAGKVSS